MDPKNIELTTAQKIVPLLKAINHEIPWQIVLIGTLSIVAAVFGGSSIPVIFAGSAIWDFIVRRVLIGFLIGLVTFGITGLTIMTIEDKIIPLIGRIRNKYNEEALTQKKKVLDNVIDDEILK